MTGGIISGVFFCQDAPGLREHVLQEALLLRRGQPAQHLLQVGQLFRRQDVAHLLRQLHLRPPTAIVYQPNCIL